MTDQWLPGNEEWGGEEREGGITKRSKLLGVMAMFTNLIMVIISWVYEYAKMYQNCTLLNMCSYYMSTLTKQLKMNQGYSCELVQF